MFRIHYENSTNTVDYDTESIFYHLLFSDNHDAGHFDALQNNLHALKSHNVKKYTFRIYIMCFEGISISGGILISGDFFNRHQQKSATLQIKPQYLTPTL